MTDCTTSCAGTRTRSRATARCDSFLLCFLASFLASLLCRWSLLWLFRLGGLACSWLLLGGWAWGWWRRSGSPPPSASLLFSLRQRERIWGFIGLGTVRGANPRPGKVAGTPTAVLLVGLVIIAMLFLVLSVYVTLSE